MNYYGIVDKLKAEHKSGIYGRKKIAKEEIKSFNLSDLVSIEMLALVSPWVLITKLFRDDIVIQAEEKGEERKLVFVNELLDNDYSIGKNEDLFYGLFDAFPKGFETIMKSYGGSNLIIYERESLPKTKKHFGGEHGKFNQGLYCTHPKNDDLLIPLANSKELIETLILEETIRAYVALGAKRILIEDVTEQSGQLKGKYKAVSVDSSVSHSKKVLREKTYGQGIFKPEVAKRDNLFIHDFPHIVSTIKGRTDGNQLIARDFANVNLSIGLDVGVLNLGSVNIDYNYNRRWYFEVEFYDKDKIKFNNKFEFQSEIENLDKVEKELFEIIKKIYEDGKKTKEEIKHIQRFCIENNVSRDRATEIEKLVESIMPLKKGFLSNLFDNLKK
ncbi:MAG: hypothetical protein K9J13_16670 [Saprospiraceae bacterium]|nr:hypothetical protein [Melioribacteraceae bacterium]MCF8299184.1 hypothetical protein [Saprospiraceae bacterium]